MLISGQTCGERKGNRDGYFYTRVRRWNDRQAAYYLRKSKQCLGRRDDQGRNVRLLCGVEGEERQVYPVRFSLTGGAGRRDDKVGW